MNKHIELARELRTRINHTYAAQRGTESYERRECAEAIEDLVQRLQAVEAQRDELLNALKSIQSRIRESAELPVTTGDVFDSFYRDVIDAAIAKAQASEPAPKECHGCRMAQKYIKQLNEENHKLLSAPKREWVGLTDRDVGDVVDYTYSNSRYGHHHFGWSIDLSKAVAAKLKELNHG